MKKILFYLFAAMATSLQVTAQEYAPFRQGRIPYFQSADSIYSLRVTQVYTQGADSVFMFNPRAVENPAAQPTGCNTAGATPLFVGTDDNVFGKQMIKKPNGDYLFIFSQGDTFLLKPNAPVNLSWTFSQSRQLTASVLNRYYSAGQTVVDSVTTINVNGVGMIRLSKNHGLTESPSFHSIVQPLSSSWIYHLHTLEGTSVGQPMSSAFQIFDYQPGDKFLYDFADVGNSGDMIPCSNGYKTIEVLSRYNSPAGDSVVYTLKRQVLTYYSGNCGGQSGPVLSPYDTVEFVVTEVLFPHLVSLRQEYISSSNSPISMVSAFNLGKYVSQYNSRLATYFQDLVQDTCSKYYAQPIAPYGTRKSSYAKGLGQVFHSVYQLYGGFGIYNNDHEGLQAYVKGTETYGNWQPLQIINAIANAQPDLLLQVYPNPFISALTVDLSEAGSSPGTLTLYNLQGQRVHQQPLLPAQTTQKVHLPSLPAGLYLLQVQQGGRSYTTKVQRQ